MGMTTPFITIDAFAFQGLQDYFGALDTPDSGIPALRKPCDRIQCFRGIEPFADLFVSRAPSPGVINFRSSFRSQTAMQCILLFCVCGYI